MQQKAIRDGMFDLTGKIALIVGLGQSAGEGWGIGAACAVTLARRGAIIFGGNRTKASAEITRSTIIEEGGECDVETVDATSSESMRALIQACMEKHKRIDILVNNVGRSEPGCPASMSEEIWNSQMDTNLKSVFLAVHYVLPVMQQQGFGAVVSISSIASLRYIGKPQVGYNATKAAVNQLTKATAVIYAARGVRLNTVVPGLMETPYTQQMATRYNGSDIEGFRAKRNAQVPMGFMGNAWDVANAVLFLVSDEARYVTGQEIVVDGGITSSTGPV